MSVVLSVFGINNDAGLGPPDLSTVTIYFTYFLIIVKLHLIWKNITTTITNTGGNQNFLLHVDHVCPVGGATYVTSQIIAKVISSYYHL